MYISVIIPVYNAERYVATAVQSACDQNEVCEVILVEDASPDSSLEICKNLVQSNPFKVKLLQHPDNQNHGAGASRNLGIGVAIGEFIAFLDADDYFLPGRFERDLYILRDDADTDGVYNALGVHIYDKQEQDRIDFDLTTVRYHIAPENLFEKMAPIGRGGYFNCDTLTVRRTIFDKVGLFDTSLELSQDTHMWLKMAAKAKLVAGVIDQPVAMRGVHAGNRIKDKAKLAYYRPLLFLSLLEWAKKNNISLQRKRLLWEKLFKFQKHLLYIQKNNTFQRKVKMFLFLVKHGFSNPFLLKYRTYYSSFAKLIRL